MVIEEKLRIKEMHLKQIIDEYSLLRDKYQKCIQDNKEEVITANGIATNAELFISVLDASNLKNENFSGRIDPYVTVLFENKTIASRIKEDNLNPVWNEDFNL